VNGLSAPACRRPGFLDTSKAFVVRREHAAIQESAVQQKPSPIERCHLLLIFC
jgi:hypothetical protein